jgi:hypothetical protein
LALNANGASNMLSYDEMVEGSGMIF